MCFIFLAKISLNDAFSSILKTEINKGDENVFGLFFIF